LANGSFNFCTVGLSVGWVVLWVK